jgi:hypothetical protein
VLVSDSVIPSNATNTPTIRAERAFAIVMFIYWLVSDL